MDIEEGEYSLRYIGSYQFGYFNVTYNTPFFQKGLVPAANVSYPRDIAIGDNTSAYVWIKQIKMRKAD